MAETEPAASAAPIVASYFGGNSGIPSYEALKQRRAIALALAARRMKAPQTVGEGLTYFGESLNDALGTYLTGQAENAYTAEQRARAERQSKMPLQEGAAVVPPPASTPPVATAGPVPANDVGGGGGSIPGDLGESLAYGPNEGAQPAPPVQMAALNTGATMSDALPPGAERMVAQDQPNPPIVTSDIQPAPVQMAQARPPAGPAAPNTPTFGRPEQVPGAMKQEANPLPKYPAMGPNEKQYFFLKQATDDPNEKARLQETIDQFRAQRDKAHDANMKRWQEREQLNNSKALASQQEGFKGPESEARRLELEDTKRVHDDWTRRFGSVENGKLLRDAVVKGAEQVPSFIETADAVKQIKGVLNSNTGLFTGTDAQIKVGLSKAAAIIGMPVNPKATNDEIFQSLSKRLYGPLRNPVSGTGTQTDRDTANLEAASAGNIRYEPGALRAVLGSLDNLNLYKATRHQRDVKLLAGDENPAQQNFYFQKFGVPMHDIIPEEKIQQFLGMHASDPERAVKLFDDAHHMPGLSQRILERYRR
jgi:hypothetical protein